MRLDIENLERIMVAFVGCIYTTSVGSTEKPGTGLYVASATTIVGDAGNFPFNLWWSTLQVDFQQLHYTTIVQPRSPVRSGRLPGCHMWETDGQTPPQGRWCPTNANQVPIAFRYAIGGIVNREGYVTGIQTHAQHDSRHSNQGIQGTLASGKGRGP